MLVILYGPVVDSLYLISYIVMLPLGVIGGLHEILISVSVALVCIRSDITPGTVLRSC